MGNVQDSARKLILERWNQLTRAALIAAGGSEWIAVGSPDDRRIVIPALDAQGNARSVKPPPKARIEKLVTYFSTRDPRMGGVQEAWGRDIRGWLNRDHVVTPDKVWRFLAVLRRNWLIGLAEAAYLQHAAALLDILLAHAVSDRRLVAFSVLTIRVIFWRPIDAADRGTLKALDDNMLRIKMRGALGAPDEVSELENTLLEVLDAVRAKLFKQSIPTRIDLNSIRNFELRAVARMVDFGDFKAEPPEDPFLWPYQPIRSACAVLMEALLHRLGLPNVYEDSIASKLCSTLVKR
ncbi:MAG TPA: hypothetical protein VGI19_17755 [Candidatus Cybelea sp.]